MSMMRALATARSHSERIDGSKEGAHSSRTIDPANGGQGMRMANESKSADRKDYSINFEKENGIMSTDARKKQGGRPVSLEDMPQPLDGKTSRKKSNSKQKPCSCCANHDQHIERRAGTGVESGSQAKSGKRRLPVCTEESLLSQSLSQVSHPNQHENMQQCICNSNEQFSQGQPECFTQFSERALLEDISGLARETFVPTRLPLTNFSSQKDATTSAENTINLDSSCPLWSQISPSPSSQPFSSKLLAPANSGNPQTGKRTGDVLANAGVRTTPKQSSSSLHVVHGPPRFSQLLTQASQSKHGLPTTTQTPDSGLRKRKSEVLYPTKCSKEAVTVQDGNRDRASRRTNLREQILASLLEPDFEDFLAEVEGVWDELQQSVSSTWNLKSL